MKRVPTLLLKAVLVLIAGGVAFLCFFLFPMAWRELLGLPTFIHVLVYPALLGFYFTIVPFYFALLQAMRLLQCIDRDNAFSGASITALKNIKYSAIAMSLGYAMGYPFVVVFSELDDAPGGIIIGFAIVCAPLIVATFAAVLQKLIQSALGLKEENDLTI